MTSDIQAKLLGQIGGGPVVWISVEESAAPDFAGKVGWLRFRNSDGEENLIAGILPTRDARGLMSGEWVDDNATTSARIGLACTITESTRAFEGAKPVLQHEVRTLTRKLPSSAEAIMRIAVYTGFRTTEDAEEGRLATIAERFIGFSDKPLEKGTA